MKYYLNGFCIALAVLASSAQAQTTAGGGDSSGNSGSAGTGSATSGNNNSSSLPPGLERRDQLPPGLAQRTNSPAASGAGESSQFGSASNRFGGGLTPTSTRTNSGTGSFSSGSQSSTSGATSGDRADTPSDRRLLTTIRQSVSSQIASSTTTSGGTQGTAATPVSFVVNGGIVQLVGSVPTTQEKQRIEAIVQRVPGVTRVVNQLQVSTQSTTSTMSHDADPYQHGGDANIQGSAGAGSFSTTNQFSGIQTNLSATGRTNDSRNLPPGLEKRDTLPPGLEKRDQLPPGLENRNDGTSGSNP